MASAPVDPNAPFLWTFGLVLPVERVRTLCVELIAQRTRVVVIHKKERLAACQVVKRSKDRGMLVARWNDNAVAALPESELTVITVSETARYARAHGRDSTRLHRTRTHARRAWAKGIEVLGNSSARAASQAATSRARQ